jgi:hypothetical protein
MAPGSFAFIDRDWQPDGHNVEFVWHDLNSHDFAFGGTNVEIEMDEDRTVVWPTLQPGPVRHVLPSGTTTLAPSPCTDEVLLLA